MTREELISVIQQAAKESGRIPTLTELQKANRISEYYVRKHFGVYGSALQACGMQGEGSGYEMSLKQLFTDWANVARQVRRVPTVGDYELHGRYTLKPLMRRFGAWPRVAAGMAQFARDNELEEDNKDILEVVAAHVEAQRKNPKTLKWSSPRVLRPGLKKGEPVYGTPTVEAHLMLSPTNEQGVVFLFGAVARSLGFVVLRIQTEYPDCEALREMETDHWQRVKIEFEYESRNFLLHGHCPEKCNLIVCWRHNWEESPLEVIELRTALKNLVNG